MIRLAAPRAPTLPTGTPQRTARPAAVPIPADDRWPSMIATIAGIMVVIFCAAILLADDRPVPTRRATESQSVAFVAGHAAD